MVDDFLKGFVKEPFIKNIEVIEKVNTEFHTPGFKEFRSDLFWQAKFKNLDCYIFLLFEFQSIDDKKLALRVLNYIVLFYLSLLKNKEIKIPLPPIFPIVIYTGANKFSGKTNIKDIIQTPYKSLETIPNFRFFLFDINELSKNTLLRLTIHSNNLSSLLFSMDKMDEDKLNDELINIIELIKKNAPEELIRDFQDFLTNLVPENNMEQQELIQTID
jgi:predicted transposase/invertase (TIGR01784 family)